MQKTTSRYRKEFSFRSGLLQEEIVSRRSQDPDRMDEAQGLLADQPIYRVFDENPLDLGFFLEHIGDGRCHLLVIGSVLCTLSSCTKMKVKLSTTS